ncbi:MAG: hypothetical protein AAF191_08655 [Verrucomicrobiota bacterium]
MIADASWLSLGRKLLVEHRTKLLSFFPPGFRLAGAFLQFLATIYIARTLGDNLAHDFFFWSALIMSSGLVATYGLDQLSLREVPRLVDRRTELLRFLAPLRGTAIIIGIPIAVLLIGYASLIQGDADRPLWWFALPLIAVLGLATCTINGEVMRGMGRPCLGVIYSHLLPATLFCSFLAISSLPSASIALLCWSTAFGMAAILPFWGPGFRGLAPHFAVPSASQFRGFLQSGLPLCMTGVFGALNYMIPLTILERTQSGEQVSYLTTAIRISILVDMMALAIYSIFAPKISKACERGEGISQAYLGATGRALLILGGPVFGVLLLAPWVMSVFGPGFVEAGPTLRVFLSFVIIALFLGPSNYLLLMTGRTRLMAIFSGTKVAVSILLGSFLIPQQGALGMAIVLGSGNLLERLLAIGTARKEIFSRKNRGDDSDR